VKPKLGPESGGVIPILQLLRKELMETGPQAKWATVGWGAARRDVHNGPKGLKVGGKENSLLPKAGKKISVGTRSTNGKSKNT